MAEQKANCGKCGICLTVCPVFKALKEEQVSPRAKNQLLKALKTKHLAPTPLLKDLIDKCLMCGSCTAVCPSGVDLATLIMEMRGELAEEVGELKEIRGLIFLLTSEERLGRMAGVARLGQKLIPECVQKRARLADIPLHDFPPLNRKPLRRMLPQENKAIGEERGTVLYFTGCATNLLFADTGLATVELLTTMGYKVIIPEAQTCCSIPMLYHGEFRQSLVNIKKNIECFSKPEALAIITDCPTCRLALHKEFPRLMRRFGLDPAEADAIAAKTTDLASFIEKHLAEYIALLPVYVDEDSEPITYHAPCHLRNEGLTTEHLLAELPGIDYRPAIDRNNCCGGGGTFFYSYPEIAGKMAQDKVIHAKETGASLWLTDCPVCRINLGGHLGDDRSLRIAHPAHYLLALLKKD